MPGPRTFRRASLRGGYPRQSTCAVASGAYRLRSRDVLRRCDLFGGQAKRDRRLCTGVAVADLARQRGQRFGLTGRGELIPHTSDRVALEILRGLLVGLKLREWRPCRREFFPHLIYLLSAK